MVDLDMAKRITPSHQKNRFNAIIIGGTGATGKQLLNQLLNNHNCKLVTSIGKRPALGGKKNDKLVDIVIESLLNMSSTEGYWKGNDVFFNCIGTTKKKAGGADQFHNIEYGISNEAARVASKSNIPHASLISASGANHKLWAKKWLHPLFYSKTMGEKEQTILSNHSFKYTSIFKPGMLIRHMKKNSIYDKILKITGTGLSVEIFSKVEPCLGNSSALIITSSFFP